jgi:hypothetical protein
LHSPFCLQFFFHYEIRWPPAVVMGRSGTSKRLSAADIAEQIERGGSSRYLRARCTLAEHSVG